MAINLLEVRFRVKDHNRDALVQIHSAVLASSSNMKFLPPFPQVAPI